MPHSGDADVENRLWTQGGKVGVGRMGRVARMHIYNHVKDRQLVGSCCLTPGTQTRAL